MNYKDFSSPLVDEVRTHGFHQSRRWLAGLEAAEDLRYLHFGETFVRNNTYGCLLMRNGIAVGAAQGGFGTEDDPALLYLLVAFPSGNANYELIAYRYKQDRFFISRDGKLVGYLVGSFSQSLRQVAKWEFYCGETLSGTFELAGGWGSRNTMPVKFADANRELALKVAAPPRYRNGLEKLLHGLSVGLWSPPLPPDPVLPGRTRFASRTESEVYFTAFVFFRLLVCR